jgi:hypothetical protein
MNGLHAARLNPFPGLRSFTEAESQWFFGRERAIADALERLSEHHVLAVLGPSGSGKSSLIRAGLIHQIRTGMLAENGMSWQIAALHPGVDPIGNLARALQTIAPEIREEELHQSSLGLRNVVEHTIGGSQSLLLLVDQFEELFRLRSFRDVEDNQLFAALLAHAAEARSIHLVITIRSDFFGDLASLPSLLETLANSIFLLPRMNRDERREAIEGPLWSLGCHIDHSLIQQILNDAGEDPDSLVRFQHVLMRTWDAWRQEDRAGYPIGIQHYQQAGCLSRALDMHGEIIYSHLGEPERETAASLFRQLCTEEGGRVFSRPVRIQELAEVARAPRERVASVGETFQNFGFLTASYSPVTEESVMSIAREGLVRDWEMLRHWVEQETESRRMYFRVCDQASFYRESRGALLAGLDLETVKQWLTREQPGEAWARRYNENFQEAMAFIHDSEDAANAMTFARDSEEGANRRRLSRLRTRINLMAILILILALMLAYLSRRIR